jgi:hypothetical protein
VVHPEDQLGCAEGADHLDSTATLGEPLSGYVTGPAFGDTGREKQLVVNASVAVSATVPTALNSAVASNDPQAPT